MLDNYNLRHSLWSGNVNIVDAALSPGSSELGAKEWSCDITLRSDANISAFIHELLHSRSISHKTVLTYILNMAMEEGPVSFLTKAICRDRGITYSSSYGSQVRALEKIRRSLFPTMSDLEFGIELFEVDVGDRYSWLSGKISSSQLDDKQKKELRKIAKENLKGRVKKRK